LNTTGVDFEHQVFMKISVAGDTKFPTTPFSGVNGITASHKISNRDEKKTIKC
jgi:hypothetical protein